ncbi:hypothetical protein [Candidatus Thioglobus sp. NP1]|uniref:hypothetical protein n=1 Tax=Candidatus Thioglobus sp. NP1 TaxID=2508687 RepID=UPI000DEDA994|nr:hypothetical protein [Candidatus Thioglobus sp. NP1]AXE62024.1 hypothetical protein CRN91_05010 [Candidatus Thioglobus sp. NP1]
MIFSIVIALLIFWFIINFPDIIGNLVIIFLTGVGIIIAIGVVVLVFVYSDLEFSDLTEFFKIVIFGAICLLIIGFIFNGLNRILTRITGLWRKFYDIKTILKFLILQFIIPGITDKQKIKKIKKINRLVAYGDEKKQLDNEKKYKKKIEEEEKKLEEENIRLDNLYLKCGKNFYELSNLIDKELSVYIDSDYINLEYIEPTRENINGYIHINTKIKKSIIKVICRARLSKYNDSFRTYKIISSQGKNGGFEADSISSASKGTKKILLNYFKLHPEEIGQ